jgi:hypothetical protein
MNRKYFISLLLALFCASPAFAYSEAAHKENMKYEKYAAAFAKVEEAMKKAREGIPSELVEIILKEQAAWFAGFDDDYNGVWMNIDMKATEHMDFDDLTERDAYAAAVLDRIPRIERLYGLLWLTANHDGFQGVYIFSKKDADGDTHEKNVLEIRNLPQKDGAPLELDIRLTVKSGAEENLTFVFHNSGSLADGRMPLYGGFSEDDSAQHSLYPLYVKTRPGKTSADAVEVVFDENFKGHPDYDVWFRETVILKGVYHAVEVKDAAEIVADYGFGYGGD